MEVRRRGRRSAWRENIEAIATAVALALVIRHFVFEAFQIPTGSMAPTLKGVHRTMVCPNCTYRFPADGGRKSMFRAVVCPNCLYEFSDEEVALSPCRNFPTREIGWLQAGAVEALRLLNGRILPFDGAGGGNRILVNKFAYDYRPPERWDVVVFKFPRVDAACRNPECGRGWPDLPRRETPSACPGCGSRRLEVAPDPGSVFPLDDVRCLAPGCGWRETTRRPGARCPVCGGRVSASGKNYIKRLVALPTETLRIRHGDIYINGKIARKTPEAQEGMWRFVYDSSLPDRLPGKRGEEAWSVSDGGLAPGGGGFVLTPAAEGGTAWADFARPITDFAAYNGRDGESIPVGDVRVEVELELPGVSSTAAVRIVEDEYPEAPREHARAQRFRHVYEARLETRLDGRGRADRYVRLLVDEADAGEPARLETGGRVKLELWNADDAVGVVVNGRQVLRRQFDVPPEDVPPRGLGGRVSIGTAGAALRVRRVRLWRDTYYRHDMPGAKYASEGSDRVLSKHGYFMMGDNSRSSLDSRMWGEVPSDYVIGKAFVVWYPFDDIREAR